VGALRSAGSTAEAAQPWAHALTAAAARAGTRPLTVLAEPARGGALVRSSDA